VVGLVEAARRGKRPQHRRPGGYAAQAGSGGGQDEAPHQVLGLVGQLLGNYPTEGDAENVDVVVPKRCDHAVHGARDRAHPPRPGVGRRLPDAGEVEADHL
jgi:hypothetical protein